MDENTYKVFVLTDDSNRIIDINSDAFLTDSDGWVQIDEGSDFRHHHAQRNYLPKPKQDDRGVYRYRLENLIAIERTQDEMDADYVDPIPIDLAAEVALLKQENAYLKEAMELILSGETEE